MNSCSYSYRLKPSPSVVYFTILFHSPILYHNIGSYVLTNIVLLLYISLCVVVGFDP